MAGTLERTVTLGDGRTASVRWLAATERPEPRERPERSERLESLETPHGAAVGQLTVRVWIDGRPYLATIARAAWDAADAELAAAVEQALRRVEG